MTDETQAPSDRAIDFGFRDIPEREKGHRVREVFDRVASRYDLMNDLMSLGVHRVWKSIAITTLAPRPSDTLLDVAGGTGDLARAFTRRGGGLAIVCDINGEMLEAGRKRGGRGLLWARGNAEHLPFPDRSMTAYTIAFGIRNVTHRDQALAEAARVLRPGGRFLCLEFSMPDVPGLEEVYDWYSFKVIPRIGQAVTGSADPYQYLVESIRRFPAPETFLDMMSAAGLKRCKAVRLSGGVATMYTGWRI